MSSRSRRSAVGTGFGRGAPARRYARIERVNETLRQVLAEEIERLVDTDERLGLLTVTGVETDPDLRQAKVLFATLRPEDSVVLEEERARLQAVVGRQVRMKFTPTLTFVADPVIAEGMRVEEIIRRIHLEDG